MTSRFSIGNKRLAAAGLLLLLLTVACYKAPITGRSQFIFLPKVIGQQIGAIAYQDMRQTQVVARGGYYEEVLKRVGKRIAAVSHTPDLDWEYTVFVDDQTVNAVVFPGGKVGVYTGIMKITRTEAELAAVMGHEVAHATARHGAEKMSFGLLLQMGAQAIAAAMEGGDSEVIARVLAVYGIGTALAASLPFSRKMEFEADRIGLIYMAQAGYDPRKAIVFWQRMRQSGGPRVAEFLSTHPDHKNRIKNLREWMPEAMEHYRNSEKVPDRPILSASGR